MVRRFYPRITVSILSRPERRLQPDPRFVREAVQAVSILSRPERRLQHNEQLRLCRNLYVSILSRPERRLQRLPRVGLDREGVVSILSRPERRLQRVPPLFLAQCPAVSILSRPERRLQRKRDLMNLWCVSFQSSAAPKDGCNGAGRGTLTADRKFQSSAAPKDGCNPREGPGGRFPDVSILSRPERRLQRSVVHCLGGAQVSILSRPERRLQLILPCWAVAWRKGFNPQPPRKTAATAFIQPPVEPYVFQFQSSAAPKDGCNFKRAWPKLRAAGFNPQPPRKTAATRFAHRGQPSCATVSILSRPERRLQLRTFRNSGHSRAFQSSAAPKDGCNPEPHRDGDRHRRFNPQPPRKTAATPSPSLAPATARPFQSSAAPKDGCNGRPPARRRVPGEVSILSRPERRLQLMLGSTNASSS